jgi:hypothetical protein
MPGIYRVKVKLKPDEAFLIIVTRNNYAQKNRMGATEFIP